MWRIVYVFRIALLKLFFWKKGFRLHISDMMDAPEAIFILRQEVYTEVGHINNESQIPKTWIDDYDKRSAHVYITDRNNGVLASARLIYKEPLPILSYFNINLPEAEHLGEFSRLVVAKDFRGGRRIILIALTYGLMKASRRHAVDRWVAFMPVDFRDSIKRFGVLFEELVVQSPSEAHMSARAKMPGYFKNDVRPFTVLVRNVLEKGYGGLTYKVRMTGSRDSTFWNRYFKTYDTLNRLIPYQELMDEFCSNLGNVKNKKILDAGAGTGNLASLLTKKGAVVWALDSSKEGLSMTRQKMAARYIVAHDLTQLLPFENNFFDAVVSNNTIYTLPQNTHSSVMEEFFRVLRTEGRIVISNPSDHWNPTKIVLTHFREYYHRNGFIRFCAHFSTMIYPLLVLWYYNLIISRKMHESTYSLFSPRHQANLLKTSGFSVLSEAKSVYGDQAEMVVAIKS